MFLTQQVKSSAKTNLLYHDALISIKKTCGYCDALIVSKVWFLVLHLDIYLIVVS